MKTQEIVRLYTEEQQPLTEIAKIVSCSPKTVRKVLLENGCTIRSRNATREVALSEDLLKDLYLTRKMSCAEIAKKLGVAHGTVHNYLKKYQLNTRSATESKVSEQYSLWDRDRLETCRNLLLEHRSYQLVAALLGCTPIAVENKNREHWQIPLSIWVEREDEIRTHLDQSRNYSQTALKFDVSERALEWKNQKSWHIDLSMNSTLFGIPTEYNGIRYRSKKEAIIAQYLTERAIVFEYEKTVKSGHNWTCDFYLPVYDILIEYDGLEAERGLTKSVPYNRDNPKIRFYQEKGYRHLILGKRTWKQQLDEFLALQGT